MDNKKNKEKNPYSIGIIILAGLMLVMVVLMMGTLIMEIKEDQHKTQILKNDLVHEYLKYNQDSNATMFRPVEMVLLCTPVEDFEYLNIRKDMMMVETFMVVDGNMKKCLKF